MNSLRLFVCCALLVSGALAVPSHRSEAKADIGGADIVKFYLFTQNNPEEPEFITLDDDSSGPSFNPNNPTRVVIHGGGSSWQSLTGGRDAYLESGKEYNIVLVDWSSLTPDMGLPGLSGQILVAEYAGQMISHMIEARGLNPDNLVIIGHSMGGQLAAIASNRAGGDQVVSELVALDPASESFDNQPLENQLDKTDAKFVQVIHTDGGGLGVLEAGRGHADFFPNGGSVQPGCESQMAICSHLRATPLYWESILSESFVAAKCSSYEDYVAGACSANEHIPMGEWTPHTASGSYYLNTNAQSPYALGDTDL